MNKDLLLVHALPPSNGIVRYDKRGIFSADIARIRLRGVIEQDREAVPCGRWVRVGAKCKFDNGWIVAVIPRYRLEQRR